MIKRKYLNDKQNPANIIYPITDEQSVRDGNGVILATKLSDLPQVKEGAALGRTAYQKPVTGIPESDLSDDVQEKLNSAADSVVEITYSNLVTLRNSGNLVPGTLYRITDYVATTTDENSRSANHPFDIIVQALSGFELSEQGRAAVHDGDPYFANSNLGAWTVYYTIDNDSTRFAWADSVNGKGVVYRLIDEWENDIPYDFKGIQFKRFYVTGVSSTYGEALSPLIGLPIGLSTSRGLTVGTEYKWYYTFSSLGNTWADEVTDGSFDGKRVQRNRVASNQYDSSGTCRLNNNVFAGGKALYDFMVSIDATVNLEEFYHFYDNHFEGESIINNTVFGYMCLSHAYSAFRRTTLIGMMRHCRFGTTFDTNTIFATKDFAFFSTKERFGNNVIRVKSLGRCSFGNYFEGNFLNINGQCSTVSFGDSFQNNTVIFDSLGVSSFGSYCYGNVMNGTSFAYNRFGDYVNSNTFTDANIRSCQFEGQLNKCDFSGSFTSCSFKSILSNLVIVGGTNGGSFAGVDFAGNIRGTDSSKIRIESSNFILDDVTDTKRRITLSGDPDGNLVATWMEDGVLTGIQKAPSDLSWSALPQAYFKPVGGIPSTDMSSDVQTSLGKADTAYQKPANGIPGSDLAPGAVPQEVFWATKDETTYNDIVAANNAGKVVLVYYSNRVYFLANIASSQARFATPFISASAYALSVNSSGSWSSSSSSYEKSTNKVDTIVGNESDTNKYPSAKGVADYIASKELSDLADVSDTAPTDGQALIWDGTNEVWKPGTVQGGSGSVTDVTVGGTSVVNQQGVAEVPAIPETVQAQEIEIDSTPTVSSNNLVTSGGVASALAGKYEKPNGGIPASDLASGVVPTVPTISTDINADATSDAKTASPKAVKTFVEGKGYGTYSKPSGGIPASDLAPDVIQVIPTDTTIPSGGLDANVHYALGTLTGAVSITLDTTSEVSGQMNIYSLAFTAGSTAPTITWSSAITMWAGNCLDSNGAPVITAGNSYEVSILDGLAVITEFVA